MRGMNSLKYFVQFVCCMNFIYDFFAFYILSN